jgi:hypothetical protein
MKLKVTLTIEEAVRALEDKFAQQESEFYGKSVEVVIERPTKIRFDKIQAIKCLREELSINPYIEARPIATSSHTLGYGATPSGFYIGLAHAKALVERIMEKAII